MHPQRYRGEKKKIRRFSPGFANQFESGLVSSSDDSDIEDQQVLSITDLLTSTTGKRHKRQKRRSDDTCDHFVSPQTETRSRSHLQDERVRSHPSLGHVEILNAIPSHSGHIDLPQTSDSVGLKQQQSQQHRLRHSSQHTHPIHDSGAQTLSFLPLGASSHVISLGKVKETIDQLSQSGQMAAREKKPANSTQPSGELSLYRARPYTSIPSQFVNKISQTMLMMLMMVSSHPPMPPWLKRHSSHDISQSILDIETSALRLHEEFLSSSQYLMLPSELPDLQQILDKTSQQYIEMLTTYAKKTVEWLKQERQRQHTRSTALYTLQKPSVRMYSSLRNLRNRSSHGLGLTAAALSTTPSSSESSVSGPHVQLHPSVSNDDALIAEILFESDTEEDDHHHQAPNDVIQHQPPQQYIPPLFIHMAMMALSIIDFCHQPRFALHAAASVFRDAFPLPLPIRYDPIDAPMVQQTLQGSCTRFNLTQDGYIDLPDWRQAFSLNNSLLVVNTSLDASSSPGRNVKATEHQPLVLPVYWRTHDSFALNNSLLKFFMQMILECNQFISYSHTYHDAIISMRRTFKSPADTSSEPPLLSSSSPPPPPPPPSQSPVLDEKYTVYAETQWYKELFLPFLQDIQKDDGSVAMDHPINGTLPHNVTFLLHLVRQSGYTRGMRQIALICQQSPSFIRDSIDVLGQFCMVYCGKTQNVPISTLKSLFPDHNTTFYTVFDASQAIMPSVPLPLLNTNDTQSHSKSTEPSSVPRVQKITQHDSFQVLFDFDKTSLLSQSLAYIHLFLQLSHVLTVPFPFSQSLLRCYSLLSLLVSMCSEGQGSVRLHGLGYPPATPASTSPIPSTIPSPTSPISPVPGINTMPANDIYANNTAFLHAMMMQTNQHYSPDDEEFIITAFHPFHPYVQALGESRLIQVQSLQGSAHAYGQPRTTVESRPTASGLHLGPLRPSFHDNYLTPHSPIRSVLDAIRTADLSDADSIAMLMDVLDPQTQSGMINHVLRARLGRLLRLYADDSSPQHSDSQQHQQPLEFHGFQSIFQLFTIETITLDDIMSLFAMHSSEAHNSDHNHITWQYKQPFDENHPVYSFLTTQVPSIIEMFCTWHCFVFETCLPLRQLLIHLFIQHAPIASLVDLAEPEIPLSPPSQQQQQQHQPVSNAQELGLPVAHITYNYEQFPMKRLHHISTITSGIPPAHMYWLVLLERRFDQEIYTSRIQQQLPSVPGQHQHLPILQTIQDEIRRLVAFNAEFTLDATRVLYPSLEIGSTPSPQGVRAAPGSIRFPTPIDLRVIHSQSLPPGSVNLKITSKEFTRLAQSFDFGLFTIPKSTYSAMITDESQHHSSPSISIPSSDVASSRQLVHEQLWWSLVTFLASIYTQELQFVYPSHSSPHSSQALTFDSIAKKFISPQTMAASPSPSRVHLAQANITQTCTHALLQAEERYQQQIRLQDAKKPQVQDNEAAFCIMIHPGQVYETHITRSLLEGRPVHFSTAPTPSTGSKQRRGKANPSSSSTSSIRDEPTTSTLQGQVDFLSTLTGHGTLQLYLFTLPLTSTRKMVRNSFLRTLSSFADDVLHHSIEVFRSNQALSIPSVGAQTLDTIVVDMSRIYWLTQITTLIDINPTHFLSYATPTYSFPFSLPCQNPHGKDSGDESTQPPMVPSVDDLLHNKSLFITYRQYLLLICSFLECALIVRFSCPNLFQNGPLEPHLGTVTQITHSEPSIVAPNVDQIRSPINPGAPVDLYRPPYITFPCLSTSSTVNMHTIDPVPRNGASSKRTRTSPPPSSSSSPDQQSTDTELSFAPIRIQSPPTSYYRSFLDQLSISPWLAMLLITTYSPFDVLHIQDRYLDGGISEAQRREAVRADILRAQAGDSKGILCNQPGAPPSVSCPRCHGVEEIYVLQLTHAQQSTKADTWGGSNAHTERYSCQACGHTWIVKHGE